MLSKRLISEQGEPSIHEASAPRRQQAEERREQILDAALRVFSEKGFAGASVRDIAREVGVTEGLLYHYFESKDQLEEACWKERSWRAHLERILGEAGGKQLEGVLIELIRDFLATLYANAPLVRMCHSEMQRNSELAAIHITRIEGLHERLCDFLRERQSLGEIRGDVEVDAAAGLLMGSAYSFFNLYGTAKAPEWAGLVDQWVPGRIRVILYGIC